MSLPIYRFLEKWDAGDFTRHRQSMCDAGWYDWFCTDRGLYGRLERMVPAIRRISHSPKIDKFTMQVMFKNNCPMWVDETYDDFRILHPETGDVLYTIIPRYPAIKPKDHEHGRHRGIPWPSSSIMRVSEVCDFVADDDTRAAIHIENLAQGKPVDWDHTVVWGTRKEMYAYFGV